MTLISHHIGKLTWNERIWNDIYKRVKTVTHERKSWVNLFLGLGKKILKEKIDKTDFIRIKHIGSSKDTAGEKKKNSHSLGDT